jgi:hypothetical protein
MPADNLVPVTVEPISSTVISAVPRTPAGSSPPTRGARVVRDRGAAFERFSRAVDGPLTVLALAMIPLLVLPLVMEHPTARAAEGAS